MVCLGLEPRAADYAAMFFFWLYTFYSFKVLEAHLIGIFMGNGSETLSEQRSLPTPDRSKGRIQTLAI